MQTLALRNVSHYHEFVSRVWIVNTSESLIWTSLSDFSIYNHGQKSWDTFAFLWAVFQFTQTQPLALFSLAYPHPQTMLDACIQNCFRVSTLYRLGGGKTARNFQKGCTVLRGNREMTEKYEYCSTTVPRTFVQDCLNPGFGENVCCLHFSYAF